MVRAPKWAGLPIGEALVFDHTILRVGYTGSPIELLTSDPDRIGVTFSTTSTSGAYIAFSKSAPATQQFVLPFNGFPVTFTDNEMPAMASNAFWVVSATVGDTITVIATRLVG